MPKLGNDIKDEKKKKTPKSKEVVSAYSEEGIQRRKAAKMRDLILFILALSLLVIFLVFFTLFAFGIFHF